MVFTIQPPRSDCDWFI